MPQGINDFQTGKETLLVDALKQTCKVVNVFSCFKLLGSDTVYILDYREMTQERDC